MNVIVSYADCVTQCIISIIIIEGLPRGYLTSIFTSPMASMANTRASVALTNTIGGSSIHHFHGAMQILPEERRSARQRKEELKVSSTWTHQLG